MSKIATAAKTLLHNRDAFIALLIERFSFLFADEQYLKLIFRYRMGYPLNLKNPQTFSEKLNWLKLYDRNPLYTKLVDKYEVKHFVAERAGEKYVIKTLGLWDSPEEIEWDKLPQSFVLKTTHGGGNSGVAICKEKSRANKENIVKKLRESMSQDLYKDSREWPYKNVPKRIIAEEYIEDEATQELRDYKFFCFDGNVEFLFIGSERQKPGEDVKFDFFDKDFNHLLFKQGHPNSKSLPEKPSRFEEMKELASKLSKRIPHVRVDLYEANGKVYFGEMTFYHFGGVVPFEPRDWDFKFGKLIHLPKNC